MLTPFPFCVVQYPRGTSAVYFNVDGGITGQLGYWTATFGVVVVNQSPAEVRAALTAGQTVTANLWFADVTTAPEPATFGGFAVSLCLLGLALQCRRTP